MSSTDWDKKQSRHTEPTEKERLRQEAMIRLGRLMVAGGTESDANVAWSLLQQTFGHGKIVNPDQTERHDAIRQGQADVIIFIQQCIFKATVPREGNQ